MADQISIESILDLKQEKEKYREQAKLHRDRLDISDSYFESIINVFFDYFKPKKDNIIAAYWPKGKEFDCRFLMDELVKQGYSCALPRVQKENRILEFAEWTHNTPMIKGAFGIEEPHGENVVPDIVIAPLLAFDQKGYRLGYGGGYYDTTIMALREQRDIIYIGVGYAEQAVLFKLPREEHDIPLDYVMTPQGVKKFKEG